MIILINSSSEYYNDICYSTKSESGTDITLKDRKTEFVEGNKTLCQEECGFHDYDHDSKNQIVHVVEKIIFIFCLYEY